MSEFNREQRYIVLKIKDIEEFLTEENKIKLSEICYIINDARIDEGLPTLETVVIESDWPMYDKIWEKIEDCVTNGGKD